MVISGPLSIVAFSDVGDLGPGKSQPVIVEWHWYYHLPNFAGWALIVGLLILVKENRNRLAWTILIPFLLLSEILWPWMVHLLSLSSPGMEHYGTSLQWFFVAWTALWLASPWLVKVRPLGNLVVAVMFVLFAALIGVAAQFGVYQHLYPNSELLDYAIGVFALLSAFALAGRCCRKRYSPGRFLAWMAVWLVVVVAIGIVCEVVYFFGGFDGRQASAWPRILMLLPRLGIWCLCMAGILYATEPAVHVLGVPLPAVPGSFP